MAAASSFSFIPRINAISFVSPGLSETVAESAPHEFSLYALASLNSVAKLDYGCCQDGISNTFSITPDTLGSDMENRVEHLTAMLDGYFVQNAHHLNVNVLNRQKLIDAMNDPTLYPSLCAQ